MFVQLLLAPEQLMTLMTLMDTTGPVTSEMMSYASPGHLDSADWTLEVIRSVTVIRSVNVTVLGVGMKRQHGLGRTGEGAVGTLEICGGVIPCYLGYCLTFHLQMMCELLVKMEPRPAEVTLRQH